MPELWGLDSGIGGGAVATFVLDGTGDYLRAYGLVADHLWSCVGYLNHLFSHKK